MFSHSHARTQLSERGWLVNVSRAQYLPDKRNLHMRVLSGDYY
jgi:ribosomal protein L28